MEISVNKDLMEKDRFTVHLRGPDLNYSISPNSVFFIMNAEQLDKLVFQGGVELQDAERIQKET